MNPLICAESLALWLADYYLLASVLLFAALASSWFLKQPAQRLAVTKATVVALFLLAMLCATPGWSLVHLFTTKEPRANSQAAPLEPRAVADLPTIPTADRIDTESLSVSPPAAPLDEPQSAPQSTTNSRDLPWGNRGRRARYRNGVCLRVVSSAQLPRTASSVPPNPRLRN